MSGSAVQYKEPMSEKSGKLAGWGRHAVDASEERTEDLVAASERAPLFRGLGRSYGDSSLPPEGEPRAVNTTLADRILAFLQTLSDVPAAKFRPLILNATVLDTTGEIE